MRGFHRQQVRDSARGGLLCLLCFWAFTAPAPECDNFFLPLDTEMADLGDYFETVHTLALEEAVGTVNAQIERALNIQDPAKRSEQLARLHRPDALAAALAARFAHPYVEASVMERALETKQARKSFPGQKTLHSAIWMNFSAHFPLGPRQMMMLFQSGTVKAFGVYFGTDKLLHFHHLGWTYYKTYQSLLNSGCSRDEAYRQVIEQYTTQAFLAENAWFGTLTTGVYSNADLAANHLGFKFFLNLTETVSLKGCQQSPLVSRCGVFWQLNRHVRPRSGWLAAYFSDHWNEALNPSLYDATMRPGIRRVLQSRAERIVQFYTQKDGRPNDPAYFDQLAHELATYYGEPYGHSGQFEKLMTIGNTCMPQLVALADRSAD